MEYFIALIALFLITAVLEKAFHIHLYKSRKERIEIVVLFFIVGVIWDSLAIWRDHWIYPSGTLGIVIGLMPVEDYLFILVVPYFILTIYKLIDSKFRGKRK